MDDFSQSGPKLLLPPKYIDEIKSNPACDFGSFVHKVKLQRVVSFWASSYADLIQDFYANYPGLEPFGTANSASIFQDAVRKELAQVLGESLVSCCTGGSLVDKSTFSQPSQSPQWPPSFQTP